MSETDNAEQVADPLEMFMEPTEEPTEQEDEAIEAASEEADDDQAEEPAEVVEADEEEATDDEPEEDEEDDALIPVKIDGKEERLTLDELKRRASSASHLVKRMEDIKAAERQNLEYSQQLRAAHEHVLNLAQQLSQDGLLPRPKAPDAAMAEKDPIGYTQAFARFSDQMNAYNAQQAQIAQAKQQQEAVMQAQLRAHVEAQAPLLVEAIPELANPETREEYRQKLFRYGEEQGFSPEILASVTDANVIAVLNKAMRYDALKSERAKNKIKEAPTKTVKPVRRGKEPPQLRRGKIIAKAAQTGSKDAWLQAFLDTPE